MNHKERMLAHLPFKPNMDGLEELRLECEKKIYQYNNIPSDQKEERNILIRKILGKTKEHISIRGPFYCDYGFNIEVGDWFYANYNLTILDVGKVIIGDHVLFGPNVSIYTVEHPIHPISRSLGYECGIDVTIGNNVWIGGSSCILSGVHIGNDVVIGAGSVVTKDIPDGVVAVGNPCRVIRKITDEDRKYYDE